MIGVAVSGGTGGINAVDGGGAEISKPDILAAKSLSLPNYSSIS